MDATIAGMSGGDLMPFLLAGAIIGGILLAIVGAVAPKGLISARASRRRFGPRGW